jgi:hypothetical protein
MPRTVLGKSGCQVSRILPFDLIWAVILITKKKTMFDFFVRLNLRSLLFFDLCCTLVWHRHVSLAEHDSPSRKTTALIKEKFPSLSLMRNLFPDSIWSLTPASFLMFSRGSFQHTLWVNMNDHTSMRSNYQSRGAYVTIGNSFARIPFCRKFFYAYLFIFPNGIRVWSVFLVYSFRIFLIWMLNVRHVEFHWQ